MCAVELFDVGKVLDVFKNSLYGNDDILMDQYLIGYEEINKFFNLMGTVFSFVSSDIRNKLDILNNLKANENKYFSSIKSMMTYEMEQNLLKDNKYVSGSRTLLRLHRGLEFVYEFLTRLQALGTDDQTYNCCKTSYNDTLAKYHPFLIRKGAVMAMYTMPTRAELLKRVCEDVPHAIEMLPEMLKYTKIVHERTNALYTSFDLHKLP